MEQIYAAALDTHLADLVYHFYEAGASDKVLAYAPRAGEQAQRLYAPRTAVEQFTRALDAARQEKDYETADKIRTELREVGVSISTPRSGRSTWVYVVKP
jgi:cysteinyl-tRNA synthetase